MKRFTFASVCLALALLLAVVAVQAQDTSEGMAVCDGDLILSLYFAEYNYNFASIYDRVMAAMSDMTLPGLDTFDKGQYAPLFDSMMGMMADDMTMPNSMLSEDMATGVVGMMTDETMMMEAMPPTAEGTTELAPLSAEGEPAECATLRTELHNFYSAIAFENAMMMEESGG